VIVRPAIFAVSRSYRSRSLSPCSSRSPKSASSRREAGTSKIFAALLATVIDGDSFSSRTYFAHLPN
jgi:hypothetical protein